VISPVDLVIGVSARASGPVGTAYRGLRPYFEPLARVALRPPLVPERLQPETRLEALAREGAEQRRTIVADLSRLLDTLVPAVLTEVLRRARLTELVPRYVDLDEVVATVDLDRAVSGVDVDRIAARLDVGAVVDRVDVDAVARRLDLDAVLDRLDLTEVVLKRVDLGVLVNAVLGRIDLVALAQEVIDEIDLPEIIRESTGSMASDTVRTARMQGISADEAVARAMDRVLLRRGRRPAVTTGPDQPGGDGTG
jgi:hypothetical protein